MQAQLTLCGDWENIRGKSYATRWRETNGVKLTSYSPGRFLASLVLKLCIAHIVMNYDMMAPVEKKSRTFYFRSAIIPKTSTSMRFRARQISDLSVMPEGCLTDDVSVNYNMGQDHGPCGRSVWDCSSSFLDL